MRIFKEPNTSNNWKCLICNTNDIKEVVLIGIVGTENKRNIQAEQIHLDCINLFYDKKLKLLYQQLK